MISKIPVQNSIHNVSAHTGFATKLHVILIPYTVNGLLYKKGNLHFSHVLEDGKYWMWLKP